VNFDKLNTYLSTFSNIAVLIGIVALVYELNQNNLIARAQTRGEISASAKEILSVLRDSPIMTKIREKRINGEPLSPEEEQWIRSTYRIELKDFENIYYQYRIGLFDENEMEPMRALWRFRISDCDIEFRDTYQSFRGLLDPLFQTEMDRIRSESSC